MMETVKTQTGDSDAVSRLPANIKGLQNAGRGHFARITGLALLLFLVSLTIYMAGFRDKRSVGDTVPAELLPIQLLERQTLTFDPYASTRPLPYWFVEKKGKVISFYSIVPGLLNVPAFWVAKQGGLDLFKFRQLLSRWTAAVACALSVAFLFLTLVAVCRYTATAVLMAAIYAFGTGVWSSAAQCLWQHGPSLLFLTAAWVFLVRPSSRWFPAAGFFLGMAVFNRPSNIVFALPCAVYVALHQRHRFLLFSVAALVPALFMAWYSQVYWGSVFALGQGHRLEGIHGPHHNHFHGRFFSALLGHLFSPGRGLFIYSPVYCFAFPVLFMFLWHARERPLFRYLAIGALAHLTLYSMWNIWWGGRCFGYRMLLEMLPVLTLFLAFTWEQFIRRSPWLQIPFWIFVIVSVYCQFLGAFFFDPERTKITSVDRVWVYPDTELREFHRRFIASLQSSAEAKI